MGMAFAGIQKKVSCTFAVAVQLCQRSFIQRYVEPKYNMYRFEFSDFGITTSTFFRFGRMPPEF